MNDRLEVSLKDGTPVLLRPVQPGDKSRLTSGLMRLSSESRYFRFFIPTPALTGEQLRYLTEVDQRHHVAWIALDLSQPAQPAIGIARYVRSKTEPHVAEAAFTVIDDFQHKGLGSYLLGILYLLAQRSGITVLREIVLPENRFAAGWFQKLGGAAKFEQGICQVDLPVHPDLESLPDLPVSPHFKSLLAELRQKLHA
jgi:GNAT superfamily N-acetyltransferase